MDRNNELIDNLFRIIKSELEEIQRKLRIETDERQIEKLIHEIFEFESILIMLWNTQRAVINNTNSS